MLRRILSLFRKPDYRESVYAHQDLSGQTRLAWHVRLRMLVSSRGIVDHAADQPVIWMRYRRVVPDGDGNGLEFFRRLILNRSGGEAHQIDAEFLGAFDHERLIDKNHAIGFEGGFLDATFGHAL